ncbi:MAG: hypothetical protein IKA47_12495 [Oscillospiraceae bacterium]|nr:hypothetical protein [Oscillospiraceae bacterium]
MRLESGRRFFYQWELDQRLEVPEGCTQVHFANGTTDKALYVNAFEEDGKRLVKVPYTLLQVAAQLRCYAWDGASVIEHTAFDVVPREKPDLYVEPEEVRRFDKLEAELQARSQGRSANYRFYSGGWKRILNFIRSSSGQLNLCVVTPGAYRMTQILSLDITGFVKYAQDTSDSGVPVIVKRYENIFGEDDAMQKKPVRITKIRVGYPKAGTEFPKADGTIDYGANPVNCYVDVYVEFDGTDLVGPYAAFNMNFAGFVENHNCEAVTEETDAPGTGYYGEELDYYEVEVSEMTEYLTGTAPAITKDNIGGGYGLKMNTNGYVGIEVATEKQIDTAKAKYLAITPTNVKYAVDLYTADLRKQYELIEDFTLEEAVAKIVRRTDLNGVQYDFSALRIAVCAPVAEAKSRITFRVLSPANYTLGYLDINNALLTTNIQRTAYELCNNKGLVDQYAFTGQDGSNGDHQSKLDFFFKEWRENISYVEIIAVNTTFPIGTQIKIYAIRG